MSACNCEKRPIIDAVGKSVKNYYEVIAPYSGGATANGKTIAAGPIEIADAFEMCNGSGVIRSASVKEFGTTQELDFDIVFVGNDGYTIATNTTTAFDATIAEDNKLQDAIEITTYTDKGQYREAKPTFAPLTVFNASTTETEKRKLWYYLIARAAVTYTGSTRLAISIAIEND